MHIKTKMICLTSTNWYRIALLQDGYIAASGRNCITNRTVLAAVCNAMGKKMCSLCLRPHHLAQETPLPGL
jgi:hypothetical protein